MRRIPYFVVAFETIKNFDQIQDLIHEFNTQKSATNQENPDGFFVLNPRRNLVVLKKTLTNLVQPEKYSNDNYCGEELRPGDPLSILWFTLFDQASLLKDTIFPTIDYMSTYFEVKE